MGVIPEEYAPRLGQITALDGDMFVDEAEWASLASPAKTMIPSEKPTREMTKHLMPFFMFKILFV